MRLAIQATGTFGWELAVAKSHGLDKQAGLDIQTTELATTEAGKIALVGGGADIILSDWLWVARERGLGNDMQFYPHSTALGAVMAKDAGAFKKPSDFVGKKLGVAGGPLDKSWLMLQAWALKQGVDLKSQAEIVFAAPPLLAEKLGQGEIDAALEFWTFAARLQSKGFCARRGHGGGRARSRRLGAGHRHRLCVPRPIRRDSRPGAGALFRHDGQGEKADRR